MSTDIDKSLDQIIKEQKKVKRKENIQEKKKKQPTGKTKGRQGKQSGSTAAAKKWQGNALKGQVKGARAVRQRGQGQGQRAAATSQQAAGKPKFLANRLKSKQALKNVGKQMLNKTQKVQRNRRTQNIQTQQIRRKDARQNIINKRRGVESGNQTRTPGNQQRRRNRNRQGVENNDSQLTVSFNAAGPSDRSRQRRNQQPQGQGQGGRNWRRQRNNSGSGLNELRVSVANSPTGRKAPNKQFTLDRRLEFPLGKTQTSLNDRFSARKITY